MNYPKALKKVNGGVLIEKEHYYTILVAGVHTIREGALIEGGALTEVVRYLSNKLALRLFFLGKNSRPNAIIKDPSFIYF